MKVGARLFLPETRLNRNGSKECTLTAKLLRVRYAISKFMIACILWRSWCGLRLIFCPCSKWLRITQRPNLGISTTHVSDSSKSRTTRKHNNDRKLRSKEIIQQDDGEQYETRSYIIRTVRLLQSLKGDSTRRALRTYPDALFPNSPF